MFCFCQDSSFRPSRTYQAAMPPLLRGLINIGLYTLKLLLNGTLHNEKMSFEETLYSPGALGPR